MSDDEFMWSPVRHFHMTDGGSLFECLDPAGCRRKQEAERSGALEIVEVDRERGVITAKAKQ